MTAPSREELIGRLREDHCDCDNKPVPAPAIQQMAADALEADQKRIAELEAALTSPPDHLISAANNAELHKLDGTPVGIYVFDEIVSPGRTDHEAWSWVGVDVTKTHPSYEWPEWHKLVLREAIQAFGRALLAPSPPGGGG